MECEGHRVYRAIEGRAHGFLGLVSHDWVVLALAVSVSFVLFALLPIPIGAAVLLSLVVVCAAVVALVLVRWRYDGRREAVQLLLQRAARVRGTRRILDDDRGYRPAAREKEEQ